MRLLRNLSISRKLALSSLFALALLGALVWSVLSTMAGQVARDASLRQAQHAEQAVQGAWLAARAVGIAGRELQFQQSPPRVGAALERADAAAAQARTLLADLAAATADEGAHKAVDAAVAALGEYAARVGQSAKLRNDMLDDRDNGFTQLQSDFTSTIKLVREDLPLEDLMPSEVEELQAHLRDYQGAIIDMRDAVNRFLATGDLTMQERVTAADASAEKNLPPMLNARISTDMKESVQDLGLAGKKMREVARRRGVSNAQVALAWLLHQPGVTAPIIGASKPEHLEDALAAIALRLEADELASLAEPYRPHPVLGHTA